MVRISDILKKIGQAKGPATPPGEITPKEKPEPAKENVPHFAKAMTPAESEETQKPQGEMHIARAMKELEPDIERSRSLYSRAVQLAKEISMDVETKNSIDPGLVKNAKSLLEEVINYFLLQDKTLINFFYDDYSTEEYIWSNMVNVMIMSVAVGLRLGFNKSRLNELALAGFLHDVGMIRITKHASLTDKEYEQIKEHPSLGAEILSQTQEIPQAVIDAVRQEHERMAGDGYPKGLKDGEISEYAQVIGVADVFETLTHSRVYRKRLPPYEAVKEMLSAEISFFSSKVLKALLDQIGIYPIGSYVHLNTEEIAKVVMVNDNFPLRPVVNIIFDANKTRLENPLLINLA
jgi:HD-GYP domain-containing protein (c-di-GMP phosphodiesterase class II)